MSKPKSVKCKICDRKYVSKNALIDHIERTHSSCIPKDWNAARYENYLRTGKTEGRCVYCKTPTGWNNATGKYNRMCGSEACKKKARELASKNYIGLHGKPYSINDPEQQKKMVYGRKNSGKYIFEDEDTGKKYVAMYDSSYGKDFFEMIDTFLNWDGSDIIAPSPHTYWYEYEGKKHFYIPDAYSTSLNLEIELKDGGDNPNNHPKIQAIDKVKEQKKDAVMESLKGQVNYIKICNKDYTGFFKLLSELRAKDTCQLPKWEGRLESITESFDIVEEKVVYDREFDRPTLTASRNNNTGIVHDFDVSTKRESMTANSYDDVIAHNPAIYDDKQMLKIINSEDVIESYNNYIDFNIDRIITSYKKYMGLGGNSSINKDLYSMLDQDIASDVLKLEEEGHTRESIRGFVKDKYFETTNDPNLLRSTLKLRYNLNRKLTNLLETMLTNNYLLLGYTEEEAKKMVESLNNSNKRETVESIIRNLKSNKNLINGNVIDLRPLGAGVIYLSDSVANDVINAANSGHSNKNYAILSTVIMYALRFDIVIFSHGIEDYSNKRDYMAANGVNFTPFNILCGDYANTWRNSKWGNGQIVYIDRLLPKYQTRIKTIQDTLINKYGLIPGRNQAFFFQWIYDNRIELREKITNARKGIYNKDYEQGVITKDTKYNMIRAEVEQGIRLNHSSLLSYYADIEDILNLFDQMEELSDEINEEYNNGKTPWRAQNTNIGGVITNDTIQMIRLAIKDNPKAKNIKVMNCNPYNIKLPKDLADNKKVVIAISNYNTSNDLQISDDIKYWLGDSFFESVDYSYEPDEFEFDSILESVENTIKQFALENDVDYDDNDAILEAMYEIYLNEEPVQESVISKVWQATIKFIKNIIKAIIGVFKAVINFFKNIFLKIKNLIRRLLGLPTIDRNISYIALENATVDIFKPRNNKDIDNKIRKSCEKMGKELQKLTQTQTKIMNEIKKDAEKQARKTVQESVGKSMEEPVTESFMNSCTFCGTTIYGSKLINKSYCEKLYNKYSKDKDWNECCDKIQKLFDKQISEAKILNEHKPQRATEDLIKRYEENRKIFVHRKDSIPSNGNYRNGYVFINKDVGISSYAAMVLNGGDADEYEKEFKSYKPDDTLPVEGEIEYIALVSTKLNKMIDDHKELNKKSSSGNLKFELLDEGVEYTEIFYGHGDQIFYNHKDHNCYYVNTKYGEVSKIGPLNRLITIAKKCNSDFQKFCKESVNESFDILTETTYYRVTYDNIGIYEALHQELIDRKEFNTWKAFTNSSKSNWLPKPPSYPDSYRSYFTEKGYKEFKSKVMPICNKYLDSDKIKVEKIRYSGDSEYSDEFQIVTNGEINSVNESSILNIERNESFSYYHLEKEKIKHSGGWDEEQYFKTLPDAVKQELSHLSYKGCDGHTRQGKVIRHVYTLGKDYSAIYLGSILITWADWYDHCESPEYNWIDTPGINMALIDEDINPINKSIAINESSDIIKVAKTKPNLIERNLLLKDPMLNYDKLMEYYRKKLFYEKLSDTEWNALYNELNNVKEYLQRVANEQNREHDKRMVYESKKALKEVDRFIAYMEDVGNGK